jgi:hypothetical protein
MFERIEVGSAPWGEECAQVGKPGYEQRAYKECLAYKKQLLRTVSTYYGKDLPEDFSFKIKSFPHDFGSYYEVVCTFDSNNPESCDLFEYLDNNLPEKWDDVALNELKM